MKVILVLGVLTVSIFCAISFNESDLKANPHKLLNRMVFIPEHPTDSDFSDLQKLNIIKKLLSTARTNSNHICYKRKTVFFSRENLSDRLIANFPKRIEDCKTDWGMILDSEHYVYYKFSHWRFENRIGYVVFTAYFWGGNIGGCSYKFKRNNGAWEQESSDCFAIAS